jgi:ribonuclease P protein component
MRLPQTLRLKASKDFARVKAQGSSHPGKFVVLSVLHDPVALPYRFGVITTKRLGQAVIRVRMRRLYREILRDVQAELLPGWIIVMIPRWRSPGVPIAELRSDWLRTARRAGILRPRPQPTA